MKHTLSVMKSFLVGKFDPKYTKGLYMTVANVQTHACIQNRPADPLSHSPIPPAYVARKFCLDITHSRFDRPPSHLDTVKILTMTLHFLRITR